MESFPLPALNGEGPVTMDDVFTNDDKMSPMSCGPVKMDPTSHEDGFIYDYKYDEMAVITKGLYFFMLFSSK